MPLDKTTAAQFASLLRSGVSTRASWDTVIGPVADLVVTPFAPVLETVNDRIRYVFFLMTLQDINIISEGELDAFVATEGLERITGGNATATLTFMSASAPTIDQTIARGFPIGTLPDERSGNSVVFVTTETATLLSTATPNSVTRMYELNVPARSVVSGSSALVAAGRISRFMRASSFFTSVTNKAASVGGRDRETNTELAARYLLAVIGRQLSTVPGVERYVRDTFSDASLVSVAYGDDTVVTRATTDAGAVDVFVAGSSVDTISAEPQTFTGVGQVIALDYPPVIEVTTVDDGVTTYTEGVDFEVALDSTGVSGSTRATDGIRFIVGPGATAPALGATLFVTYSSNQLVRNMQADRESPNNNSFGSDVLFRAKTEVTIDIEAGLKVLTGFSYSAVATAVEAALVDFVALLGFGDDVEESDLQAAVRRIRGVDNFVFTILDRSGGTSAGDITISGNEYARVAAGYPVLTPL